MTRRPTYSIAYATLPLPNPSNPSKKQLKIATKNIKDCTEIAKSKWAKSLANEVNVVNIITPKEAWRAAYKIRDGVKGHHKRPVSKNFRKKDGSLASSSKENAQVARDHFAEVLNTKRPVMATKLIKQHEISPEIGLPPSWDKFKKAVFKLKNDKQPGQNGVMPNAFKCLDNHNLTKVYHFILRSSGTTKLILVNGMKVLEL